MEQDLLHGDKAKLAYQLAQEDIQGIKVEINRNTIGFYGDEIAVIYLKPMPTKGNKELCKSLESKGWECSGDRNSGKGRVRVYSKRFDV